MPRLVESGADDAGRPWEAATLSWWRGELEITEVRYRGAVLDFRRSKIAPKRLSAIVDGLEIVTGPVGGYIGRVRKRSAQQGQDRIENRMADAEASLALVRLHLGSPVGGSEYNIRFWIPTLLNDIDETSALLETVAERK
jgi:hypothetical protein